MIPQAAIDLAKRFEGLHKVENDGLIYPYLCPAGYPTIGYGHVVGSLEHPPITKEEAEELLIADLEYYTIGTLRLCPVLAGEREERLGAIVDFAFNLGLGRLRASTLRRRINERQWGDAAHELRRWVRGSGRILPGLVARREAEALLLIE